MATQFRQLNNGWNAEPNAPDPTVRLDGSDVVLTFLANPYQFQRFAVGQRLALRFTDARRYRLGATNDEGWYRGQCRFSREAPAWGEFYEISGDLKLERSPDDWCILGDPRPGGRHFLFYLRDETFECDAGDWILEE
jgi:hypothetical protein